MAGVIVGYITYKISEPKNNITGLFSVLIGLLGTLVVTNLLEFYRQSKSFKKANLHLAALGKKIAERLQDVSDLVQILRYGTTTFPRERVPDLWINLLWKIKKEFWAANYIKPEEGWNQAFTELGLEIQRTKVRVNNADIRRVFIVESEDEIDQLRDTMHRQKNAGIQVRYIFKEAIETKSMLKTLAEKIETFDFALVDAELVFLVFVDKDRKITHGKVVLFEKEEIDKYKRFYTHLFEEAKEVKEQMQATSDENG